MRRQYSHSFRAYRQRVAASASQRERRLGIDPDDGASRWLSAHDSAASGTTTAASAPRV